MRPLGTIIIIITLSCLVCETGPYVHTLRLCWKEEVQEQRRARARYRMPDAQIFKGVEWGSACTCLTFLTRDE